MQNLLQKLKRIDGKGYKAYKDIKGKYGYSEFKLNIDHVQGDPFAAPSRISVEIDHAAAAFPRGLWEIPVRKTALEDYLTRRMAAAIAQLPNSRRGSGRSGEFDVVNCGQQVLKRNAVLIHENSIEARLTVGLPAVGRKVLGIQAQDMFSRDLPAIVEQSLYYANTLQKAVQRHVETVEDQTFLRQWVQQQGLVGFIANDAVLPRRSGIDDRPLEDAVCIQSPPSMRREVILPNAGTIQGMAIKKGITLVVGGGFHGKSTLLNALETGIYNHVPGDGRERVVTDPTAMKIRAEDGRKISHVNISPFITDLPFGRDTLDFSTENASGSTSQAANIVESLDHDCRLLLIDEDTSATNFMIRDQRMQALVSDEKEPITPLLFRVRELYNDYGVSSIIVMGGSGDYFSVSDRVVMLDHYQVNDVTERASELAGDAQWQVKSKHGFQMPNKRKPPSHLLDASRGKHDVKIDVKQKSFLFYGRHQCDLSKVEQLADIAQTKAIGLLIHYYARHYAGVTENLQQGLIKVFEDLDKYGLDVITPFNVGNLAEPRLMEVAAAINRLRERPR